jgi:hypothetical protein
MKMAESLALFMYLSTKYMPQEKHGEIFSPNPQPYERSTPT